MPSTLVVAHGARALEDRLYADIGDAVREAVDAGRTPSVLVLVPSGALRRRVAVEIARRHGPAVLGVRVASPRVHVGEVLARAGRPAPAGDALLDLFVRRAAAGEPDLAPLCAAGDAKRIAVLAASVRDLLSAGAGDVDPDRLVGLLAPGAGGAPFAGGASAASGASAAGASPDGEATAEERARARARAVVRTAARTARAMRDAGAGRTADAFAAAAALLASRGDLAGARVVFVHGFADAPGRTIEYLRALAQAVPVRVYLDLPPDPAAPADPAPHHPGPARFAALLGLPRDAADAGAAPAPSASAPAPATSASALAPATSASASASSAPACLHAFTAAGIEAEAREIAHRVREAIVAGAVPEEIGVVARAPETYALALRSAFEALGVPFSGGEVPEGADPADRARRDLLELLAQGTAAPVETWLELSSLDRGNPVRRADLRLALHTLGAGRVAEAAREGTRAALGDQAMLALPVRGGVAIDDDAPEGEGVRVRRRAVPRAMVAEALDAAAHLCALFERWPDKGTIAAHLGALETVLGALGTSALPREVRIALRAEDRRGFEIDRDEFLFLLERMWPTASAPLGGKGGGVQFLGVSQARGVVFARLFVAGLNRGVFPRTIAADPLLDDASRVRLAARLPALALKSAADDDEGYLFAQLLASAEDITLSWRRADDDGRAQNPSSFIERLRLSRRLGTPVDVPRARADVLAQAHAAGARPRTIRESLQLAALRGSRALFDRLVPRAVAEAGGDATLALARTQAMDELEPHDPARFTRPGPYMGLVPPCTAPSDVRHGTIFVTRLEAYAACPWQTLLSRLLRLEPAPDPLGAMQEIDRLLVGTAVHRALQTIAGCAGDGADEALEAALERAAVERSRPGERALDTLVREAAAEVARDEGITLTGLHDALAARAMPFVQRALDLDWAAGPVPVLAAEVTARVPLGGRTIAFKADRVDRTADALVLTDYKTGAPISDGARPDTRRRHLATKIEQGLKLQTAAYAALGGPGAAAEGTRVLARYVALREVKYEESARLELASDDPLVTDTLPQVVEKLAAGWDRGVFLPRVVLADDDKTPRACTYCSVKEACPRADASARRRIAAVARAAVAQTSAAGGDGAASGREGAAAGREGTAPDAQTVSLAEVWRLGQESGQ